MYLYKFTLLIFLVSQSPSLLYGKPTLLEQESIIKDLGLKSKSTVKRITDATFHKLLLKYAKIQDQNFVQNDLGRNNPLVPPDVDLEIRMNPKEIIEHRGYKTELHKITTRDGYILGVFRIPEGRNGPSGPSPKPVVFLMHGMGSSAGTYLTNFQHQSLAFVLADAGYDVWIGNMRGNRYSRMHTSLDPEEDYSYWRFTIDHVAKYDLPDTIDYILKKTGNSKVAYVGHSLGTTHMFAALSSSPELNNKVRLFVALTPVASVANVKGVFPLIAPLADFLWELAQDLEIGLLGGGQPNYQNIIETCNEHYNPNSCEVGWSASGGYDGINVNRTRIPIYSAYSGAGISVQTLVHLGQIINRGTPNFKMFDHGPMQNMAIYGQSLPPDYKLSNIKAPMAFFYASQDVLSSKEDLQWILKEIGAPAVPRLNRDQVNDAQAEKASSLVFIKEVPTYQHQDFVMAHNANKHVYEDILDLLKKYN